MSILSAAFLLFLVMDPLGNVPMFLVALKDVPVQRHRKVVTRELCIALAVMLTFLFVGRHLLELFQISRPALSTAGGLVLFLIAIRMIFPAMGSLIGDTPGGEPFIVPLAIPLVAGPSTLITITLLATREPDRWPAWLAAIVLAWGVSIIILCLSDRLSGLLGRRGLIALERLMGMILTTVAVQMLFTGIEQAVEHYRTAHLQPG